jgi:hypothetical protein
MRPVVGVVLKLAKKAEEAVPASIGRAPRCEEKKHNSQCVKNKGHKGLHMANSQDFVLTWGNK